VQRDGRSWVGAAPGGMTGTRLAGGLSGQHAVHSNAIAGRCLERVRAILGGLPCSSCCQWRVGHGWGRQIWGPILALCLLRALAACSPAGRFTRGQLVEVLKRLDRRLQAARGRGLHLTVWSVCVCGGRPPHAPSAPMRFFSFFFYTLKP
jgi:hypothetical protein